MYRRVFSRDTELSKLRSGKLWIRCVCTAPEVSACWGVKRGCVMKILARNRYGMVGFESVHPARHSVPFGLVGMVLTQIGKFWNGFTDSRLCWTQSCSTWYLYLYSSSTRVQILSTCTCNCTWKQLTRACTRTQTVDTFLGLRTIYKYYYYYYELQFI